MDYFYTVKEKLIVKQGILICYAKISQRLIKGFLPIFILIEENIIPEDGIKWDPTNFQWDLW